MHSSSSATASQRHQPNQFFFQRFQTLMPISKLPFAASWSGTTSLGHQDEDSTNMMGLRRNPYDDRLRPSDLEHPSVSRPSDRKCEHNPMRLMGILVVGLAVVSVVFSVSVVLRDPPSNGVRATKETKFLQPNPKKGAKDDTSRSADRPKDKLLGGLLDARFSERSCLSRYQSTLYRKELQHNPSSHLLSKLRNYEALHEQCGPNTESYNQTLKQLQSGRHMEVSDCNYLVWIPFSGLGNRIISLASAFLYALLTNRVLLVDPGTDIPDLFCEPFPNASWLLPLNFPLKNQFDRFDQNSPFSYGKMPKNQTLTDSNRSILPPYMYLHLAHDYDDQDKMFFCNQDQSFLQNIPWLIMKTDNYFVPALFLIPTFEQELSYLFPGKETVFHFLGRYLFHPTNPVWGLITRYYQAYLAKADERIGIQIRVFDTGFGSFQYVLDQIIACTMKESLLPEINTREPSGNSYGHQKSKAVLMTSLNAGFFEKLRNMYWEHPTVTGEVMGIYQPSHEERQQTGKKNHDMQAWAEMYLLSLTDVLVTSSWSTFGYVAQGLGGIKPWILYKPENQTAPDPPCHQAMSMEPCFHDPPFYDCKAKTEIDTGAIVPYVRHCEDRSWGLKLFAHSIVF